MRQLASLLPIIVIIAIFWLLLIRPAQRRQAQAIDLQKSVVVGDEVVLTSGIFGTVVEDTEDHLGIEVAEGVTIRILRGAIASKVHRDPDDTDATPGDAGFETYTSDGDPADRED